MGIVDTDNLQYELTPLKRIKNPKGDILHGIKKSEPNFQGFGEAYFSIVNSGEKKGWKRHNRMVLNLIVPIGNVRFYFADDANGVTSSLVIGESNYARLTIQPGVWVAFAGLNQGLNLLLNIASIEHDPDEANVRPLDSFGSTL